MTPKQILAAIKGAAGGLSDDTADFGWGCRLALKRAEEEPSKVNLRKLTDAMWHSLNPRIKRLRKQLDTENNDGCTFDD